MSMDLEKLMKSGIETDEEETIKEESDDSKQEDEDLENTDKVKEDLESTDIIEGSESSEDTIKKIREEIEKSKIRDYDLSKNLSDNPLIDRKEFNKLQKKVKEKEKYLQLDEKTRNKVDNIKNKMDLTKAVNISIYGSNSQKKISDYSKTILKETKSRDNGEVGKILTELMVNVKNSEISGNKEKNPLKRLFKKPADKIETLMARQESIEKQINIVEDKLDESHNSLMKDIMVIDKLYQENLEYFENLNTYIIAGKEIIKENNEITIPKMLEEINNIEDEGEKSKAVQQVRDYQSNLNRFEKRVFDLETTRVVSIQMMPQLKMIQDNDSQLADKIQDALTNVVPLWRSQFVIAASLGRQKDVLDITKKVSDTTNELIRKNSDMLHQNTVETKKEVERSTVDIETLEYAHQTILSTLEETAQIEEDARRIRKESEARMQAMEEELRQSLIKRAEMNSKSALMSSATSPTQEEINIISG